MRTLAVFLFTVLFWWASFADAMLPRDVVKVSISAAQEDKLGLFIKFVDVISLQTQKEQARSPEEVIQLLKGIDLKSMSLDDPRGEWKRGARATVVMSSPLKLRFVLLCTGLPDGEPRWKIVEIFNDKRKG